MTLLKGFHGKYDFLSNFYICDIFYNGHTYKSAEHAFQASKANTEEERQYIADAPTPGQAKARGRKVCLRSNWEENKDQIMADIIHSKFQNPSLKQKLLASVADNIDAFCESNWWHDNYWGDCQCDKCKDKLGQNKLGKIITAERERIITETLRRKERKRND